MKTHDPLRNNTRNLRKAMQLIQILKLSVKIYYTK